MGHLTARQAAAAIARAERRGVAQDQAAHAAVRAALPVEAAGDLAWQRVRGQLPADAPGLTEAVEHRAVVLWAAEALPQYPDLAWLHHSPNEEGWRGTQRGAGVARGFPDFVLCVGRGAWAGLAIELKAGTGRVAPAQDAWLDQLTRLGWYADVARGFDAARHMIINYLEGRV